MLISTRKPLEPSASEFARAKQTPSATMAPSRLVVAKLLLATLTLLVGASLALREAAAQQLRAAAYLNAANQLQQVGGGDLYDAADLLAAAAVAAPATQQLPAERNSPGHYEFDAAPAMEPPSVRKPPYTQTNQVCPGSDLFGGFSPRDTLCGDLNQGEVPRNPLGQSVTEQPYPFELIKNKTLQFLARALPVLRLEYDTIPKVARYLPANRLLNPTHVDSPLGSDHFEGLNQRLGGNFYSLAELGGGLGAPQQTPLKRRKRSPQPPTGAIVGQLMPNATLVVSSAHSSAAGRIQSAGQLAVVTRDGYKPVARRQVPQPPPPRPVAATGGEAATAPLSNSGEQRKQTNNEAFARPPAQQANGHAATSGRNHASGAHESRAATASAAANAGDTQTEPLQARSAPAATLAEHEQPVAAPQPQRRQDAPQSSSGQSKRRLACGELGGFSSAVCQTVDTLVSGAEQPTWLRVARQVGALYSGAADASANPLLALFGALSGSAQQGGAETSSAAAQLDPPKAGLRAQSGAPSLLAMLSPLASLFAGSSPQPRNDLSPAGTEHRSASAAALGKLREHSASSLSVPTMAGAALAGWATATLANLFDYFVPSALSSLGSRSFAKRKKPAELGDMFVDTPASLAAAAAGNQLKVGQLGAQAKQPPTPCPSVEEYISPTFARNYRGQWKYVVQIPHEGYFTQTIQRSSCTRQRCEFTEGVCHEAPRWVSLLVAEIYYPNAVFNGGGGDSATAAGATLAADQLQGNAELLPFGMSNRPAAQQQQPQLVGASPSTASNIFQALQLHQASGAKPAAPLQTQDPLQMTDSLSMYNHNNNQNAANGLSGSGGGVAALQGADFGGLVDAASLAHMRQQIAAAQAHNYQLLQRNGQTHLAAVAESAQQQQQLSADGGGVALRPQPQLHQLSGAESRVSSRSAPPPGDWPLHLALQEQQQQLSESAAAGQQDERAYGDDIIKALAYETIRRNPTMSISDIIKSLQSQNQLQTARRKRRDVSAQQQQQFQARAGQPQFQQRQVQPRSSAAGAEQTGSPNELGGGGGNLFDAQQQQHMFDQMAAAASPPHQVKPSASDLVGAAPPQSKGSQAGGDSPAQSAGDKQQPDGTGAGAAGSAPATQDCDGYDKIGCYTVRVYYDWFLVNGSCKCWRTATGQQAQAGQQQAAGGGNSFLRRIFTG